MGNHTHNHLKGWETENDLYLKNFKACQDSMEGIAENKVQFFRPPYGQLKSTQAKEILKTHKVLMWSVLTKDYDTKLKKEDCLKRSIVLTRAGSIVLFHDSLKAQPNLYYVLPKFLKHFSDLGYQFCSVD